MRRHGTLKRWNDDRGFGFIEPNEGPPEIFVHIKAYRRRTERPRVGERITFTVETDPQGRLRAADVRLLGAGAAEPALPPPGRWRLVAIPAFALGAPLFARSHPWLPVLLAGYLVASAICFAVYAWDKAAAQRGDWRVPESTLLLLGLAGGWPGGLLAQFLLRHKSSKRAFQSTFWATVLLNAVSLAYLLHPSS
jgi:uncharacterized membrane protein YsdA (DUF1294 family)/cold shock CspA family protein